MSISFNWFKSKKVQELQDLQIEEQRIKNDLLRKDLFKTPFPDTISVSIVAAESKEEPIENNPIVYKTKIDTTFALYNKKYIKKNKLDALSLGGEFTCKHLPWEKNYNLPKKENIEYLNSKLKNISATINE